MQAASWGILVPDGGRGWRSQPSRRRRSCSGGWHPRSCRRPPCGATTTPLRARSRTRAGRGDRHVGHWRVGLPDYAITWSDEVYRIHGLDKRHHVPTIENAVAAYHPGDVQLVRDTLRRAEARCEEFEFTARLIRPDGEIRHVVSRGVPQLDRHGVVTALFGVFLDLTDQKRIEASLQRANREAAEANRALGALALEDCLTGLANRRRLDTALDTEFRRAGRNGRPLALIMLDVDHFKAYNDIYGHPAGDDCLRAIGGVLRTLTQRAGDLAARCGGEEFAVLMPDTDEAGAAWVAERIVDAVRALGLAHAGSDAGCVSISAGVAALIPLPGRDTAQTLCQAADTALYRSKDSGRGRVTRCFMQPDLSPPAPPRVPEWI